VKNEWGREVTWTVGARAAGNITLGTQLHLAEKNFAVTGAIIWNNLPADLRLHSQSLLSFGQKLKQYLFEP